MIDWGKVISSKTLWLNVIAIVLFIVQFAGGHAWINPEWQALILGVLNMVVRFMTTDALTRNTP